jgi:hypothetical protein
MGVVAESPVVGIIEAIGQPLSVFGIPNPLLDKVMEAEFETEPSEQQAQAITAGIESLRLASSTLSSTQISGEAWTGTARENAEEVEHCTADFLEMLIDCYIMLTETVIQVVDYIVDVIRFIVKAVEILLGLLLAIAAIAFAWSVITAGGSLAAGAAAAAAAMGSTFWVITSFIASIAVIGNILVWAIDALIEWIQDGLASARERGCFKGEAPLPDWDQKPPSTPW